MENQKIVELGEFCMDHHITIDELTEMLPYFTQKHNRLQKEVEKMKQLYTKKTFTGNYIIDHEQSIILDRYGNVITTKRPETLLAKCLVSNYPSIVSKKQILSVFEQFDRPASDQGITVYAGRLNHLLRNGPKKYVLNVYGLGYRWNYSVEHRDEEDNLGYFNAGNYKEDH